MLGDSCLFTVLQLALVIWAAALSSVSAADNECIRKVAYESLLPGKLDRHVRLASSNDFATAAGTSVVLLRP